MGRFGRLVLGAASLATSLLVFGLAHGDGAQAAQEVQQANVVLRLQIGGSGSGQVVSSPPGISCSASCSASFPTATTVTLTATPTKGSAINYWSVGDGLRCRERGNSLNPYAGRTCTLTMDTDHGVYVTFNPAPTLRLQIGGSGSGQVVSSPPGISCSASCFASFPTGTTVTLTATPTKGSAINYWSVGEGLKCREQGNSLTPYAGKTCTLTMDTDHGVYVTFNPAPTLSVYMSGAGTVRSSPAGIACSESCKASFPTHTKVVLTATPAAGWKIDSWSAGCLEQGNKLNPSHGKTCTLVMDAEKSVNISFVKPPSLDPGPKPPPPPTPPPSSTHPQIGVVVSVSGNGSVVSSTSGTQKINCGAGRFRCSNELPAGTRLTLRAIPSPGFVFASWGEACSGKANTCVTTVASGKRVSASFAAKDAATSIEVRLQQPDFRVRWVNSMATGTVLLRGFAAEAANIRIEIRGVSGASVLTTELRVAGSFSLTQKLTPGRLLPGGFVAVLTGSSGGKTLPQQLATVVLASPPQGVVARAFVSRAQNGAPIATVPGKASEVWAVFVFGSLPKAGQAVAVRWYWPNGKLLGEIKKSPGEKVSSFMRANPRLPSGAWRVELRVGHTLVKVLRVRIGCTKC